MIDILADHGAPKEIRLLAKPHIGTDILVKVVRSIREDIVRMGGDVRFLLSSWAWRKTAEII